MVIDEARVIRHAVCNGPYRLLELRSPAIASAVRPGQFVHLEVPNLPGAVLRRPFSVFRVEENRFSILYKPVGKGTEALARVAEDTTLSVMGPLGNGFPVEQDESLPVLVAGGYGVAPLYLLAKRLSRRGVVFVGGATARDILCEEDFASLSWPMRIATEDGSAGEQGLVTDVLDTWLGANRSAQGITLYACGPDGMLRGVGERAIERGCCAWLSMDRHMGCGLGACLACVQRVRDADGHESWKRVCREGPVFEAREIVWE